MGKEGLVTLVFSAGIDAEPITAIKSYDMI